MEFLINPNIGYLSIVGAVAFVMLTFVIPRSKIADTVEGLQATHDGGQRYPIPHHVRFEPELPERYMKLTRTLKPGNP